MRSPASSLVRIGKIIGPHGLRGMLKVHLYSGDDRTLRAVAEVMIGQPAGEMQPLRIAGLQNHGRRVLLLPEGVRNINDVLSLVGGDILVRRDQLPEPDEDEYYWADLIGLTVVTDDGRELGTLREIIETGSNDVYVVLGGEKEYLIPAIGDVVRDIDLDAGTMTVTPLDGLLDL